MSPLPSLAYARLAIAMRNVDFTVAHVSTCIVNVNHAPYILKNTIYDITFTNIKDHGGRTCFIKCQYKQ